MTMKLSCGDFEVEFSDQFGYSFKSTDNARRFERESYLEDEGYISSQHAVIVSKNGEEITSHIFAAGGGGSGVYEHSVLIHENRLFLAVGNCLCALEIPSLNLIWKTQVDTATCFGIHLPPRRDCLISHGELEISRVSFNGQIEWQKGGADIFTGTFELYDNHIEVEDWNDWRYRFDMKTGKSEIIHKK